MKKVCIIGSGFSSLSAACYLAKEGFDITVLEKNSQLGGRARVLEESGFKFDMGPSWYWMPDVFESFFEDFKKKVSDYYSLIRLSPAYKVFFKNNQSIEIPGTFEEILEVFEKEEEGSARKLKAFMKDAHHNYEISIKKIVQKPGLSPLELVTPETVLKLNQFFSTISKEIRKNFKSDKLRQILEFPVLFLGAKPTDTPLFYNFMNYADFVLGTWYPKGGMGKIIEGILSLSISLGVKFKTNCNVAKILTEKGIAKGVEVNGTKEYYDLVVSGADYHHTESLLDTSQRQYSEKYWSKRTFAPSSLLFYVGFNKKLKGLRHHNLFFDENFEQHAEDIYGEQKWPEKPLFYASFPSLTDDSVAPEGSECGFFLIPIAPGLKYTEDVPDQYFELLLDRIESHTGESIRDSIVYKKHYCVKDFENDYNSYKGNAYGMANTLRQTAFLRPGIISKKVKNLYFTGQLTVPGPGVPPALISGKIVAKQVIKEVSKTLSYD